MPSPPPSDPHPHQRENSAPLAGRLAIARRNRGLIAIALVVVAMAIWYFARNEIMKGPSLPHLLVAAVPLQCRQVVLVLSPNAPSIPARLWMLERANADDRWREIAGPVPVTLGRNGLAWGEGEHSMPAPAGFPIKHEGDGCSPAGVFRIPFAFGYAPATEAGMVRIRYVPVTETLSGVDDVNSKYYNQVVDAATVAKDWDSNETMLRPDGLYRWGAFIAHNPRGDPGRGSCIFFHLWNGPGRPTAGCTAMEEKDVVSLLSWLDPAMEPRLVQGLEGW